VTQNDTRKKNRNWYVAPPSGPDEIYTEMRDGVTVAILMDIRDELQKLNNLLHCGNFTGIPQTLKRMDRRLAQRTKLPKGRTKR
jgi:hypothetical protein